MDLEMVLNELSLSSPAPDVHTARRWMSQLVDTLRAATVQGVNRVLRTYSDLNSLILAPDYPMARWRNDPAVEREKRQFFRVLATKAPILTDINDTDMLTLVTLSEFKHQEDLAVGLGVAYLLEALAVSALSEERWNASTLQLGAAWLDELGQLTHENVEIVHASQAAHIQRHSPWIETRLRTAVRNGLDLWNRRHTMFPSLNFCTSVGDQLVGLQAGSRHLRPAIKRLSELNGYSEKWREGPFRPEELPSKASPETGATLQQYGDERTFQCPDGQFRLFSWHVRLTPEAWRIYFYPEERERAMIIGYIGPHLRTVTDPT